MKLICREPTRLIEEGSLSILPEMAIWAAMERVKEAREIKAEAIVTACPFCIRDLQDAAQEFNEPIKVFYLTEIVAQAL